jgi:two-component system response regulator GlrR
LQTIPKGRLSVLIVDDDKAVLKVFGKILQKKGHKVDTAETGSEALKKIEAEQYDMALIDVRLQDMNGLDLLNRIQTCAPNMTKIVLTGYPSDEDRATALERGADEYLAKPIKSEKLIEIVESKLGRIQREFRTECRETPQSPAYEQKNEAIENDWPNLGQK